MRSVRLNDLFALFFDPRVPALFLIGSLVLAVFGNAVYDLLVGAFGTTPQVLVVISLSAILIFVFVVIVLQKLLARRRREAGVPEQARAPERRALVLLVSPHSGGGDVTIIEWHARSQRLRHCWLITTSEASARAQSLEYELRQRNVRPYVVDIADANDVMSTYVAVLESIEHALRLAPQEEIVVDISGGTKLMTAGAALACLDSGVQMEYLVPGRQADGSVDRSIEPVPMVIRFQAASQGSNP